MTDNPSVNRCLEDKALDHVDHALGRPAWPLRDSHRNYFATDAGGRLARAFESSAHWRRRGTDGRLTYFQVTEEGRKALAAHLASLGLDRIFVVEFAGHQRNVPAPTASKARYHYWLDIIDVLPDVSFLTFVRRSRVRRAA